MKIKEKNKPFISILIINILVFIISNIFLTLKYEQVDDFIIYNLYSGLDGTYNIHGIYINPIICYVIGLFYKINSNINWHTIFLLFVQFISFTVIGTVIYKRKNNKKILQLYTIAISIIYPIFLSLIQYTSTAVLPMIAAFMIFIDIIEYKTTKRSKYILMWLLFLLGTMIRLQAFLIILPFIGIYMIIKLVEYFHKNITKKEFAKIIAQILILFLITIFSYLLNSIFYQNDINSEFMKFNKLRSTLHDLSYIDYDENKEIFDEIGWSENDWYLFYQFNFGDENVFNTKSLEKLLEYKISKNEYLNLNLNISSIFNKYITMVLKYFLPIYLIITYFFVIANKTNDSRKKYKIFFALIIPILLHLTFIIINRTVIRVIIPGYILAIFILLYNINIKEKDITKAKSNINIIIMSIIFIFSIFNCKIVYNFETSNLLECKEVINYANSNKENVYLYTIPSLQNRYLAYNVYKMPPKSSFSNLRSMGGWDMYTENYFDFKKRNNLEGNFLDVLKENVYVIDAKTKWSGIEYNDFIKHIKIFIKEHYNKNVEYKKTKDFGNIYVYKFYEQK